MQCRQVELCLIEEKKLPKDSSKVSTKWRIRIVFRLLLLLMKQFLTHSISVCKNILAVTSGLALMKQWNDFAIPIRVYCSRVVLPESFIPLIIYYISSSLCPMYLPNKQCFCFSTSGPVKQAVQTTSFFLRSVKNWSSTLSTSQDTLMLELDIFKASKTFASSRFAALANAFTLLMKTSVNLGSFVAVIANYTFVLCIFSNFTFTLWTKLICEYHCSDQAKRSTQIARTGIWHCWKIRGLDTKSVCAKHGCLWQFLHFFKGTISVSLTPIPLQVGQF